MYNFKIQYRAGAQSQDADGLSRRPNGEPSDDWESKKEQEKIRQFTLNHLADLEGNTAIILPEVVGAICEKHQVSQSLGSQSFPLILVESLSMNAKALPPEIEKEEVHGLPEMPHLSIEDLIRRQRADPEMKEVIDYLESNNKPANLKFHSPAVTLWMRQWNKLELKNGLLYRKRMDGGKVLNQLALPQDLRGIVLTSLHDDMGHLGLERTLDLLRSRFYWPKMVADVDEKIKKCERCVRRKTHPQKAAPLVNIQTHRPLQLVCMDFLTLEPDSSNNKDILVITDHFKKYAVTIPT